MSEILWQLKTVSLPCCEVVLSLVRRAAQSWSFRSSLNGFAAIAPWWGQVGPCAPPETHVVLQAPARVSDSVGLGLG